MAKSYRAEHHRGIATPKLPTSFSREIGRIIVRWAYFEHIIQETVWQAMQVTPEVGRLAAREPRVTDRLEMLADLVRLRGASMDWEMHKSIKSRAETLSGFRDLFAHAIWGRYGHEWIIQKTKGKWPKELESMIAGPRKVIPESLPMTVDKLKGMVGDIDTIIEDLKALRASAVAPMPSPGKPA